MNRLGRVYLILFVLLAPLYWDNLFAGEKNSPRLRKLDFTPFQKELNQFSTHRATEIEELLRDATILDLQAALKAGKLTSEELTLFFLDRIQRFDENLRSYTELNPNALVEARAADALRARGIVNSHLLGIPMRKSCSITVRNRMQNSSPACAQPER